MWVPFPDVWITGRGEPERVQALYVTDGTLSILNVHPQLGRLFAKTDDAPSSPDGTVLTYGCQTADQQDAPAGWSEPHPQSPSTSDAAKPATANNSNPGMSVGVIRYPFWPGREVHAARLRISPA